MDLEQSSAFLKGKELGEAANATRPVGSTMYRFVKRALDIAACSMALVLLLPVFILIALAIALDSRGPVLYRQTRIGLGGKPFRILKFRSMVPNADRIAPNVSPTSDPRVTRVGRLLRASYLDELPQLINVITGSMSIVGPRPETPEFVALYSPEELRVLSARPGLIGPSTLASMDESALLDSVSDPLEYYVRTLMHERVSMDLGYLDDPSLRADLAIIGRQFSKLVLRRSS